MTANLYYVKCLTNLHVGSGDVNYNIIDNEVERDPVTEEPTIHASGMKGALRQYFCEKAVDPTLVEKLFGSPVKRTQQDQSASTPGSLKILGASLLARPVRVSDGQGAYRMATNKTVLTQLRNTVLYLTGTSLFEPDAIQENVNYRLTDAACEVEGCQVDTQLETDDVKQYLEKQVGANTVILTDEALRGIALPVIARNYLENGESKNLWYEEYVPHESLFWFMVLGSEEDVAAFDAVVNEKVVQFGGLASLGCGLCKVEREEAINHV